MQRIYVDSRSRVSGTNENFEFALPYSIHIPEESMMVVDSVCVPNSMYTISEENDNFYYNEFGINYLGQITSAWTIKQIPHGYYDVNSFAKAVELELNTGKLVTEEYTVSFNSFKGVLEISNPFSNQADYLTVFTRELLQDPIKNVDFQFPDTDYNNLRDCSRELGMLFAQDGKGFVSGGHDISKQMRLFSTPMLQPHVNLFLKSSSLGMPATSLGPQGSMTILRRVIMQAPQLALNIDHHTTHYDSVRIAPQSISSFKISLCGFDGKVVDLRGQPFSFSLVVFPRD